MLRCALIIPTIILLLSVGCQSVPKTNTATPAEIAEVSSFWEPYLLYTCSNRYTKLHVEIDAIEGAAPTAGQISLLQEFLTDQCDKPDGVTATLDDTISRDHARGRTANSIALEHMHGPPDDETAYMYVLYYDSKVTKGKKQNPVALLLPYPGAILIDCQYGPPNFGPSTRSDEMFLLHEASHLLGLTRNTAHGDGMHCTNLSCFNNAQLKLSITKALLFQDAIRQRGLCSECQDDLTVFRQKESAKNLRFMGPYMLREEATYQVATLPGYIYIHAGPVEEFTLAGMEESRAACVEIKEDSTIRFFLSGKRDRVVETLPLLAEDPYAFVRDHYGEIKIPELTE